VGAPDSIFPYLSGPPTTDGFTIALDAPPSVSGYSVFWELAGTASAGGITSGPLTGYNYRRVDYSDILAGSAALAGIPYGTLNPDDFALFAQWHDRRLQVAWEMEAWSELCPVEQRTFRAPWDSTVTYAATTEVFDVPSQAYYQSLQNGNLNNPPTIAGVINADFWAISMTAYSGDEWEPDTPYAQGAIELYDPTHEYYICWSPHTSGSTIDLTQFSLLTPFNRYIDYNQTWPALSAPVGTTGPATPIGEFMRATDFDPRITTKLVEFPFWLSQDGAQFVRMKHEFTWVWLTFRLRRVTLGGCVFNPETTYLAGFQMYYVSTLTGKGNFYAANTTTTAGDTPDSQPDEWTLLPIPYTFRGYLIQAGYADWLRSDGQADKAGSEEGNAMGYLEMEADKFQRQQGQVPRFNMRR